ncbi:hypothetical protein D1BOALGB6SA_5805 [Olavius sp. associated proteobacterium Delta 1]|nr:hypothetical protein D1BOALGB6SA_5805 [Olavius sp. associated proteobacterium Delta 1]
MTQIRRQTFAVTSSLQYKFLATTLIYSFMIVSFFVIAVVFPDVVEMSDESLSSEIRSSAADRMLGKNAWVWPAVILLITMLSLHSFLEFRRITGPLYRFRWVFEQVENGKLPSTVKLRKKDYLIEEMKAVNKMLISLVGKLSIIREETAEAINSFGEVDGTANKNIEWSAGQIELLKAHREHLERLSAAVQFFEVQEKQQI